MKHYLSVRTLLLAMVLLVSACNKEDKKLAPSGIDEYGYHVPQGNHDYDQRIVDYYNRFGTYVLYKFTQQDINWQITGYDANYHSVPADTNYVSKQLDLLDTTLFRYYPDSTLRKILPVKFFLCSSLYTGTNTQVDAYALTGTNLGGYRSFAANWGSSRILNITNGTVTDSVALFRGNVNYSIWKIADLNSIVPESASFLSLSDYITALPGTATNATRYKRGFLRSDIYVTILPSSQSDYYQYLQVIVSNKYTYLTDASGINPTDATFKGILSPVKDSSGIIRRKYNAMVNYYKNNYNVDLQRIGNGDR